MKSIEQAIENYLDSDRFKNINYNEEWKNKLALEIEEEIKQAFKAGVEFAQDWISIKITPEWYTGSRLDILVKNETFKYPASVKIHTICSDKDVQELKAMFTHWRYLELK